MVKSRGEKHACGFVIGTTKFENKERQPLKFQITTSPPVLHKNSDLKGFIYIRIGFRFLTEKFASI